MGASDLSEGEAKVVTEKDKKEIEKKNVSGRGKRKDKNIGKRKESKSARDVKRRENERRKRERSARGKKIWIIRMTKLRKWNRSETILLVVLQEDQQTIGVGKTEEMIRGTSGRTIGARTIERTTESKGTIGKRTAGR